MSICDREMFIFVWLVYTVVVLVSVCKCSLSRVDSSRQFSSLTALLSFLIATHEEKLTSLFSSNKHTHTHSHNRREFRQSVSLTHTSVIVLLVLVCVTVLSCWPELFVHFSIIHQNTKNDFLYLNHRNNAMFMIYCCGNLLWLHLQ